LSFLDLHFCSASRIGFTSLPLPDDMATVLRRPLSAKPVPFNLGPAISPFKTTASQTAKRPRSPDIGELPQLSLKRSKPVAYAQNVATGDIERRDKDRRRAEREAQKEEFRVKYRKAFPSWVFYFNFDVVDANEEDVKALQNRVLSLGGVRFDRSFSYHVELTPGDQRVDDFFSNDITHLVTNLPMPVDGRDETKENAKMRGKVVTHKSPSKAKSRSVDAVRS
jgi:regulatory subunit for Cdc7p protein kinase